MGSHSNEGPGPELSDAAIAIHGLIRNVLSQCRNEIEATGNFEASIEWDRRQSGMGVGLTFRTTHSEFRQQTFGLFFFPLDHEIGVETKSSADPKLICVIDVDDLDTELIRSLVTQAIFQSSKK